MASIYRRIALRVAMAYRTVNHEAVAVISGMAPLHLLVEERTKVFGNVDRSLARKETMENWQREWDGAENGHWTWRLIRNVKNWHLRNHGQVTFHLTQVLLGHGCFNAYLKRFGKLHTEVCSQCGVSPDDVEHAFFNCDAWHNWRRSACGSTGLDELTPDNLVPTMLRSESDWSIIRNLIERILSTGESEERMRQLQPA